MRKSTKRKVDYWVGVFWSVAFLVTCLWFVNRVDTSPKLQSYQAPEYSLEQFTE